MAQANKPSGVYLAIYIIACICSFGAVWFLRSLITHAIYEAQQLNK